MKQLIMFGAALVLIAGMASGVRSEESPFSARLDVGGIWMRSKGHLEAGDDNKRINSYTEAPKSETEFMPVPAFELAYQPDRDLRFYAGIPLEDDPRPTLGVEWETESAGEFDVALFYSFPEEVWEDPYLLGVNRKETDQDEYGFKIAWEAFDLELSYELAFLEVDNDAVGLRLSDLKRDGEIHEFGLAYEIEFGDGLALVPGIELTKASIDGPSNEYQGIAGGLTLMKMWEDVAFMASVEIGQNDYDKTHPIFGKTRKDDTFETMAMLSWMNPLGYEKWVVNLGVGYEKTESDIDFYDSSATMSFLTIGYRFGEGGGRHHDDDDDD